MDCSKCVDRLKLQQWLPAISKEFIEDIAQITLRTGLVRVNRTKPHRELVSIISGESATDEIHKIRIETAVLPDHCLKRRRIYFLAASGDENANTEELPNHFMALEGNRKLPQHKPQNYRAERSNNNSTAETNEGLNPQFHALHSSQRSYYA